MSTSRSGSDQPHSREPSDFSLMLGGPLYRLWRRTRLSGDTLQLLHRRVIASTLLAWVPLFILSIAEGRAWGGSIALPFLHDIEAHARFLLALPLLVLAELIVHQRMLPVVEEFTERGLIPDTARAQFDAAIASALRLRNSIAAEVLLIVLVYVVGVGILWRMQSEVEVVSWYGAPSNGRMHSTLAGWWLACVSVPLFQFLLLRWFFRLFIWARFQWQVSRIGLSIMPTHPDRCGGLGFLAQVSHAFSPFLLAQGVLVAGMAADRIFYGGAKLLDFKPEFAGVVVVMMLMILGPLLVFSSGLAAAKRKGLREYGALAQRHAREFDEKWLRSEVPADARLVGSPDISSLADFGIDFDLVNGMRAVPFTLRTVVQLAGVTLLPVAPLVLTMMPLEEFLQRLMKIVI
jgi:hypothetical protein